MASSRAVAAFCFGRWSFAYATLPCMHETATPNAEQREARGALRRYRVVFRASSDLRLMERPGDSPATWRFQFGEEGPEREEVSIRDVVELKNDVPVHRGFETLVERTALSLNEAVDAAVDRAESVLILLAAAARARVGPAELLLAYDITPGVRERAFAQWFLDLPLELGKHAVPRELFGALWERVQSGSDLRFTWRVVLSLSWHRMALEEVDAIRRFFTLWVAFEALGPLLAESFQVEPKGFGGLRALAAETGAPASLISQALALRRDVFHARRVTQTDAAARANAITPELEELLIAAWGRLLDLEAVDDQFPEASIVPRPMRAVFRATLLHDDETIWGHGNHPHFSGGIDQHREDTGDPREVRFWLEPKLTLHNADEAQPLRLELRGPKGPKFPTMPEPPPLPGHAP